MNMRKLYKGGLVLGTVVFLLLAVTVADRIAQRLVSKQGRFTLMMPEVTEVYETAEFTSVATVSSQGLRNKLVALPKPSGTYRVLALGDSFTFGWGVSEDQSWPWQLEAALRSSGEASVEVINAGAPGMTIDSQIVACRVYKQWFDPDLIILGVYVTDDLYQIAAEDSIGSSPVKVVRTLWPTLIRLNQRVLMHSWHEKTAGQTAYSAQEWRRWAGASMTVDAQTILGLDADVRQMYLSGRLNPSIISFAYHAPNYLVALLNPDAKTQVLTVYGRYARQFMRTCGSRTPVVVVVIPSNELVSLSYHSFRQKEGYQVDPSLVALELSTDLQRAFGKNLAGFVSLLEPFREDGCPDCYYPWDTHMTPAGHTRVTAGVAPVVGEVIRRKTKQ